MRHIVKISCDDSLAALQILAFLAYPHRPEFGLDTLLDWAAHRSNRNGGTGWPTNDKWDRVHRKLWRLDDMVKRRLQGAYWLRLMINHKAGIAVHAAGQRACARRFGAKDTHDEKNVIRLYWDQTRSVAHLGLATGDAIMFANSAQERTGPWDLTRVAFRADWIPRALQMAEENAANADRFGVVPLAQAVEFRRQGQFSGTK